MKVRAWFLTLVYQAPLMRRGVRALNREIVKESAQLRELDKAGQRWSRERYPGGYTSYGTLCQLHRMSSTFMELERRLRRHVRAFASALDYDMDGRSLEMTDCWVNIMPRHCAHGLHLHPTSTISGSYYVKTPRGCSRLKFEDPRLAAFMAAPPRVAAPRDENRQFVEYAVDAGQLILFESWLRHEVPASRIAADRISVSFNWNWF